MAVEAAERLGQTTEIPDATVAPVFDVQPCLFMNGEMCK